MKNQSARVLETTGDHSSVESPLDTSVTSITSQAYFAAAEEREDETGFVFHLGPPGMSSASVFSVDSVVFGPDTLNCGSSLRDTTDYIMMNASARYSEEETN